MKNDLLNSLDNSNSQSTVVDNVDINSIPKTRLWTLISGIFDIIGGIALCIFGVYLAVTLISETDPLVILASLGIIALIYVILGGAFLLMGITIIGIGILQIRIATMTVYEYVRRRGKIIFSLVLDALIIIGVVVGALTDIDNAIKIIIGVLGFMILLSFIFKISDLKRADKIMKEYNNSQQNQTYQQNQGYQQSQNEQYNQTMPQLNGNSNNSTNTQSSLFNNSSIPQNSMFNNSGIPQNTNFQPNNSAPQYDFSNLNINTLGKTKTEILEQELSRLSTLLNEGKITQSEYEIMRSKVINDK